MSTEAPKYHRFGALAPGQSANIASWMQEAVQQGAIAGIVPGPAVETSPHHFEAMVAIVLDGQVVGDVIVSWDAERLEELAEIDRKAQRFVDRVRRFFRRRK